jgi:hypothetical protein
MPDDAIERARQFLERQYAGGLPTYSATEILYPESIVLRAMIAFASQQAPEGWAIALHLSKQEEGACITSIVLSVHNGTSEADALKRAIDYAAVEKPGFAVEQYLAQKYPPAMLDAAPSVVEGV